MKRIAAICIIILTVSALIFAYCIYDEDVLIPFEIDGKIGFVDRYLTIKFQPCYKNLLEYRKSMILVRDFDLYYQVLFSNGRKAVAPKLGIDSKVGLLGDNFYFFKVHCKGDGVESIYGTYEIYDEYGNIISSFSDRELFSSKDLDWIHCLYNENGNTIEDFMDIKGTYKWKNANIKRVKAFYPEYNIGIVENRSYVWTVVNGNGEFITNSDNVPALRGFSCGLSLGAKLKPWRKGYFNKNLELVIEVERIPEYGRDFKCDVIPCVIENNKIYLYEPFSGIYSKNWCILNNKGQIVKSGIEASNMSDFSDDGTAILRLYEEERDSYKCWLINTKGEKIIDIYFDEIKDSVNGYCRAKKDGIDYLISSKDGSIYRCSDFNNVKSVKTIFFRQ